MKHLRRPRNTTIAVILIFLVSFGFWLNQPQPEREIYRGPDISWVIVTTTTIPVEPETTVPPETVPPETVPPETVPPETVPPENGAETTVVTTTVP